MKLQVLLGNHLKDLNLPTFAREYEKVALDSAQDRAGYPRYLLRLCELEHIERERCNVERSIRLARFPQTKSFETFDFTAQPSFNKALRWNLHVANGLIRARTALPLNFLLMAPQVPAKPVSPWRCAFVFNIPMELGLELVAIVCSNFFDSKRELGDEIVEARNGVGLIVALINIEGSNTQDS